MEEMDNIGRLVYETPINRPVNTIRFLFFSILLGSIFYIILFRQEVEFTFASSIFVRIMLFILLVLSGLIICLDISPVIRIYENGFTKLSFLAAYLNYWPEPIHINNIEGYIIEKTSNGTSYCKLSLANGKNYVIYSGRLEKKASKYFREKILKRIEKHQI